MPRIRMAQSLNVAAQNTTFTTATISVPTGFCIQVNSVGFIATTDIITVGLTDLYLMLYGKAGAAPSGVAAIALKTSVLFLSQIADAGAGQAAAKNLTVIGSGQLQRLVAEGEAIIAPNIIYMGMACSAVKATAPTVQAMLDVDYEFVPLNLARSTILLSQV